ncbi:hypothetical protein IMSHALPRED_002375 [Imshaugia aleurites]|uniref:P-loop containing nucleoside triphosphate hydrolase protein n=1 Tax=Imshaugia aleurites TaxID=172621 RepID=A0A8H3F0D6_9LECA|nr:hypothetical protein IMSHALPRED_002375 [Imshaugia aleurites]
MAINDAIRALKHTELPTDNSNTSVTQLPANILEAFIPGYSLISKFLLDSLGFDITLLVSVCFLIFGLATSLKFAWKHTSEQFSEYFMSYIRIDSGDDIYDHVMEWIGVQNVSKTSRKLMAKTGRENAWDLVDGDMGVPELDSKNLVNFSNWDAMVPPRFQPSFGTHRFFHKGRLFQLKRENRQVMQEGWAGSVTRDEENITLTCIGRSTQPIKDLIKEARDHYLNKEKSCTVVRRPTPKEQRGRGRTVWTKVATRPSRPMETVVLDHEQKNRVLVDINEYLHPSTPRWYANRGIPYRRGYLFHGPPGTGKSSLAWAIAGVFGLDIYCISLVDPTLTEEDLGMMFTSLPRRCVVLLEDIDSAGLSKRQEEEPVQKLKPEDEAAAKIGAEITRAIRFAQRDGKPNKENPGISLSGLLNAIDGVASHEGRVLLMTTNFPDKLDEALIRPGRVDMKVQFTNATRDQICELFTRMYSPDTLASLDAGRIKLGPVPKPDGILHQTHLNGSLLQPKATKIADVMTPPESPTQANTPTTPFSPSSIEGIAAQFADQLPEDKFTPAEVQGFLLTRKTEPTRALDEVGAWRDGVLEARKKKSMGKAEAVG